MATKKAPLTRMKELFKDKESLVDRVVGAVETDGTKEELKARLLGASNKKLMRLLEVATEIKSKYGSSQKLAEAVATAVGKAKDGAYVAKLVAMAKKQPARVLDMARTAAARASAK